MVANNPEKIGSRTCMTSGAIKSVDNELADMKFWCGIIRTPSDRSFIFLVRHALGEELETLGSMDRNSSLLHEATEAFESALRADAVVGVFDDVMRSK